MLLNQVFKAHFSNLFEKNLISLYFSERKYCSQYKNWHCYSLTFFSNSSNKENNTEICMAVLNNLYLVLCMKEGGCGYSY